MPNDMRTALQSDAFMFGGLKTHAQLLEASKLLLDENGNLKSFNQVSNDFNKLNNTYNKNYLESEYEFAVGSAQMAGKWSGFSDDETRYYLQYRTANDGKVRDEHKALHNITLPKNDPFWDKYYAPNGWRCRCNVIEVLAEKYPTSNSKESIAKGEKATTKLDKNGKNTAELFRFNPGKDKKLFAPENTFTKLAGAKSATPVIKNLFNADIKKSRKAKDNELNKWASNIIKKNQHLTIKSPEFITSEVRISRANIGQVLKHIANINNKDIVKDIVKVTENAVYKDSKALDDKDSKNYGAKVGRGVESYNYYKSEWNGRIIEINMEVMKNGYEQPYAILFDKK